MKTTTALTIFAAAITCAPITAQPRIFEGGIVNGATFEAGIAVPGEILSIFGSQLSPGGTVSAKPNSMGTFDPLLIGVGVLFQGAHLPILMVSDNQINVVLNNQIGSCPAPFRAIQMNVEYGGMRSNPVFILCNQFTSSPGIFSINGSGRGQGAILNEDFSVNSAARPATAGSIVMIYATGGGKLQVPDTDGGYNGSIATEAVKLRNEVRAFINGKQADVLYAGLAPGLVTGVFQVNMRIPESLATRGLTETVNITLSADNYLSNTVQMAVR